MTSQDNFYESFSSQIGDIPGGGNIYVKYGKNETEEIRYIPIDENWAVVENLMEQSLAKKTDLLWERYKNNHLSGTVIL